MRGGREANFKYTSWGCTVEITLISILFETATPVLCLPLYREKVFLSEPLTVGWNEEPLCSLKISLAAICATESSGCRPFTLMAWGRSTWSEAQGSARDPAVTELRAHTKSAVWQGQATGSGSGAIPAWVRGELLRWQKDRSEHFSFWIRSDPEKLAPGEILVVHLKI